MIQILPKNLLKSLCMGSFTAVVSLSQAVAAPILPDVFDPNDTTTFHDTNANGTFDSGIDVAYSLRFDDFYAFPIYLLDKYFPTAGWDLPSGSGNLDLVVTTFNNKTNSDLGYNIPEPTEFPANTSPINGTWGNGGTSATTMLVDDLYQYLSETFQTSIPAFMFDQNEIGSAANRDLRVTALVEIIDPTDSSTVAQWSLDNLLNGIFDPLAYITSAGQVCVPDGVNLNVNADDCFSNNLGSGSFEQIVYAPTMNLANFLGQGYIFQGSWNFLDIDNGGEEIALTGRFSPDSTPVPVPGTLFLMSFVVLLSAVARRLKRRLM